MVGIPRSKGTSRVCLYKYAEKLTFEGCRICVQRRVKCDQAVPQCKNCLKGNRPCPGYGPLVKFQDEGPRLREKYDGKRSNKFESENEDDEVPTLSSSADSSRGRSPVTPETDSDPVLVQATPVAFYSILGFLEDRKKAVSNIDPNNQNTIAWAENRSSEIPKNPLGSNPIAMMLPPAAFVRSPVMMQMQLLQGFCDSMAPNKWDRIVPEAMKNHGSWLKALPAISGSDSLLDSAIRAVTIVHMGRLNHYDVLVNESRRYYGKALKLLNRAIMDPVAAMDNKTLCATMLLSYYEMFSGDTDASWIRHAGGAGTLMKIRGPQRHRYGLDREVYLAYRYTLVIESFQNDVPCFLNEPEWRKLSREIHDDVLKTKLIPPNRIELFNAAQAFFEHLAEMSQTFADAKQIPRRGHEILENGDTFRSHAFQKTRRHRQELKRIQSDIEAALEKLGSLPKSIEVDDPVITIRYSYVNVWVASILAGCWTVLYNCNHTIIEIGTRLGPDQYKNKEAEISTLRKENRELALNCCRGANYMLQSSFVGPFFAILALRISCRHFKIGEPEWDWTVAKLMEIGDRHMTFARYLPYFGTSAQTEIDAAVSRANSYHTKYTFQHRKPTDEQIVPSVPENVKDEDDWYSIAWSKAKLREKSRIDI